MSEILPVRASFVAGPPSAEIPDADLALINATTARPFAASDLAVFACVMATQDLTTYATRLGTSSLINFAADAGAGSPYLLDHDPDGGVFGYTYAGQYDAAANEARAAVFLPRGRRPAGYGSKSSDQEIADIQSGMRRSVSVGFGGPLVEWRCDVCGHDVFSAECPHLPGMKADGRLATATVENARLLELSGVYNGACPGAVIGKAQQMYAASCFGAKQFRGWLDQLQVPDPTRFVSDTTGQSHAPGEGEEKKPMREKFAAALAALGMTTLAAQVLSVPGDEPETLAKNLSAQVDAEVKAQIARDPLVSALAAAGVTTPAQVADLAACAKMSRQDLQSEAEKEAVRCFGADGGPAKSKALEAGGYADAKQMVALWRETADAKYGIGKDGQGATRKTKPADAGDFAASAGDSPEAAARLAAEAKEIAARTRGKSSARPA